MTIRDMDKDALRQGKWDAIRELEEDESKIDIIFALFGVTNDPYRRSRRRGRYLREGSRSI